MISSTSSDRAEKAARVIVGNLSSSTVDQLVTLYDACECAAEVWLGAVNKPRSCYEGDDKNVVRIMDEEMDRLWHIQELIVAEFAGAHRSLINNRLTGAETKLSGPACSWIGSAKMTTMTNCMSS
jgi:hypothetical protein